jgi:hypothetical protein
MGNEMGGSDDKFISESFRFGKDLRQGNLTTGSTVFDR